MRKYENLEFISENRLPQRSYYIPETGVTGSVTWDSVANTYRTVVDGDFGSRGQFGGDLGE